jgi:hypothetical protein
MLVVPSTKIVALGRAHRKENARHRDDGGHIDKP